MIPSFRELLVWKKVDKLAHKVFDISETFPDEYVFDLTNSLRKSALSIPENIAEGWACFRPKESLEYLNTSRRSLIQTQYLLLFACKRNLIKEEEFNEFHEGYKDTKRQTKCSTASSNQSETNPTNSRLNLNLNLNTGGGPATPQH